ncbi:hypothetical protein LCGC14_1841290, partial [marine sediment metagenome]
IGVLHPRLGLDLWRTRDLTPEQAARVLLRKDGDCGDHRD